MLGKTLTRNEEWIAVVNTGLRDKSKTALENNRVITVCHSTALAPILAAILSVIFI